MDTKLILGHIYIYIYIYVNACRRVILQVLVFLWKPQEIPLKKAQNGSQEGFFAKSCPWNCPKHWQTWDHQNRRFEQKSAGIAERGGQKVGWVNRWDCRIERWCVQIGCFICYQVLLLEDGFQRQLSGRLRGRT